MLLVYGDRILPQLAVQTPGAFAVTQPLCQPGTVAVGDVDRISVLVNETEIFRDGPERHITAADALGKGPDDAVCVQLAVTQTAQTAKIVRHRFRSGRVCVSSQSLSCRADGRTKQLRRKLRSFKNSDLALLRGAFSLAVAAARCLHDRVKPRHLPVNKREVHIHAGFDQRGRYHTARPAFFKASSDPGKNLLTLSGDHESGQMEAAL